MVTEVDPRWSMAYAAALGDLMPTYMDTRRPESFVAHPLFSVCFQWPLMVEMAARMRGTELSREEAVRAVHATHDLILHRPIRPPERLSSRATIVGVEPRRPGAYMTTRLDTVDESGAPVATTWYGTIYRAVEVTGPARPPEGLPAALPAEQTGETPRFETEVAVSAGMAHVYTECARIYNPIHTDIKVAQDAGLPDIILHGTATLALAVSRIVESEADADPSRVGRVAGRFRAMVLMPSHITVRVLSSERRADCTYIHFDVLNEKGELAIVDGRVGLRG